MGTKIDPETSKAIGKLEKSHAQLASATDKKVGQLETKLDALAKRVTKLEEQLKAVLPLVKDMNAKVVNSEIQIAKLQKGWK